MPKARKRTRKKAVYRQVSPTKVLECEEHELIKSWGFLRGISSLSDHGFGFVISVPDGPYIPCTCYIDDSPEQRSILALAELDTCREKGLDVKIKGQVFSDDGNKYILVKELGFEYPVKGKMEKRKYSFEVKIHNQ